MLAEIAALRRAETEKVTQNSVADWVIYRLPPQITNADKNGLKEEAVRRFGARLSPQLIRMIVEATVAKELMNRARAAAAATQRRGSLRSPRR